MTTRSRWASSPFAPAAQAALRDSSIDAEIAASDAEIADDIACADAFIVLKLVEGADKPARMTIEVLATTSDDAHEIAVNMLRDDYSLNASFTVAKRVSSRLSSDGRCVYLVEAIVTPSAR